MKSLFTGFIPGLLIMGCSQMVDPGHHAKPWSAEVHLQEGFERHWISVALNNKVQFEGYLSHADSKVRPLATFGIDVSPGNRQLSILLVPVNGNEKVQVSILEIPTGSQEFNFIGLSITGSSIRMAVQDDPFQYV
ncbi:MAG: hypothetical protein JSU61_10740 [Fidelibacterota bacterium]|nr:MAG: hypothetical protein JSU61_10740 [Candidatus Neomarinimicrobiota bacterium]